eukprot:15438191-Alexandrium_andersonii.AAC.1
MPTPTPTPTVTPYTYTYTDAYTYTYTYTYSYARTFTRRYFGLSSAYQLLTVELRAIQEFLSGSRYRAICTNREKGQAQGLPFFRRRPRRRGDG